MSSLPAESGGLFSPQGGCRNRNGGLPNRRACPAARVRAMGVQPFYKRFAHDGVHGPNMATVYSDRGLDAGRRSCFTIGRTRQLPCSSPAISMGDYLRRRAAMASLGRHRRPLSGSRRSTDPGGMKAAKAQGAVQASTSNFREKLGRYGAACEGRERRRVHRGACRRSRGK